MLAKFEKNLANSDNLLKCSRKFLINLNVRRRARGGDGLDPDRLLRQFDAVVHSILVAGE